MQTDIGYQSLGVWRGGVSGGLEGYWRKGWGWGRGAICREKPLGAEEVGWVVLGRVGMAWEAMGRDEEAAGAGGGGLEEAQEEDEA